MPTPQEISDWMQYNGLGYIDPQGRQMMNPGESFYWYNGADPSSRVLIQNPSDQAMPVISPTPPVFNATSAGVLPVQSQVTPSPSSPPSSSTPSTNPTPFPPSSSWLSMIMGMMPPRPAPPTPISSIFNPASFAPQASSYTPTFPSMGIQADLMGSQVKTDTGINDITSKAMSSTDSLTKMAGQSGYGGTMQASPAQSSLPSFSLSGPSVSMPVSAYPSTMLSPLSSIDRNRTGK